MLFKMFCGKAVCGVHGQSTDCRAVYSFLSGGSSWNTTELPELQDDLTSNYSFEASMSTLKKCQVIKYIKH